VGQQPLHPAGAIRANAQFVQILANLIKIVLLFRKGAW